MEQTKKKTLKNSRKIMNIKGEGFLLRPIRMSDAQGYWEVNQDPESQRNFTTTTKSLAETKKEVRGQINDWKEKDSQTFTILVNGRYAGGVVLQHQNFDKNSRDGRIHVWIHPNFRGKGLATKAWARLIDYGFEKKFDRIYVQCKAINKKVIKVIKKLGFKKVKTIITKKDEWHVGGIKKILWIKENHRQNRIHSKKYDKGHLLH